MTWEQQELIRILKNSPGTAYQEADDVHRTIFRDWIRSLLQQQSATVSFVKADGSVRDMRCTLDFRQIPQNQVPRGNSITETTHSHRASESLAVFDLDLQQWRSFRFDRLKSVSATIEFDK